MQLAREARCIERVYSTTSVASQQQYALPTYTLDVVQVRYDGEKIQPQTMREDDVRTGNDSSTTTTGTPEAYFFFANTLYFREIPDTSSLTIQVWVHAFPQAVSANSTLEVPEEYHNDIINYVVEQMALKEKNFELANYYGQKWQIAVAKAIRDQRRKRRGDAPTYVQDVEWLTQNTFGVV